ncbi:MAG TPA: hypoxanthine phosphoribosyltransferase [Actinomycetota bacterium]|nr:hypoxanthine phosphoribosyltransferase [Actinomycetota bacterium]
MTPVDEPAQLLFPHAQLRARIRELGAELTAELGDTPEPPLLVGVLKGSSFFFADLIRTLAMPIAVDFMSISSYSAAGTQSGVVRIVKDLEGDITGRDVVIVEDIVDTGLTLNYLRRTLGARHPRSLRAVTLLDKAVRRIVPVPLEMSGFDTPDVFVVGYGLDFQGLYRNVPDILAVKDLARLANDPKLLVSSLFGSSGTPG